MTDLTAEERADLLRIVGECSYECVHYIEDPVRRLIAQVERLLEEARPDDLVE
jgi:hypothetical protein